MTYCSCVRLLCSVIAIEPMLSVCYTMRHSVCLGGAYVRQKCYSITLLQMFSDVCNLAICAITLGSIHNYFTVLFLTIGIVRSTLYIVVFLFSYYYKVLKWV